MAQSYTTTLYFNDKQKRKTSLIWQDALIQRRMISLFKEAKSQRCSQFATYKIKKLLLNEPKTWWPTAKIASQPQQIQNS